MSAHHTRAQRYARLALDSVKSVLGNTQFADEYKPRAMSFPTMVLQAGLAQAVGFLAAKSGTDAKGKAYQRYLDDLAKVAGQGTGKALLEQVLAADLAGYRLLTRDVLDAAGWLKRFCQTLIKDKGNGDA